MAQTITDLEAALARVQEKIENTYRPEEMKPTKLQMKRYNDTLDKLTTARREIKARIVELRNGAGQVFPNDIANQASWAAFEIMKQRQMDGLLESIGRNK